MNGPTMLSALLDLHRRDPHGIWSSVGGTWWVDHNGVAHGRVEHAGASATSSDGTMGKLLSSKLCQRRSCVSVIKIFGEVGMRVGASAQAFAEAVRVVDDAALAVKDSPYQLHKEGGKRTQRLQAILEQKTDALNDLPGIKQLLGGLHAELDAIIEDGRRAVQSESNRESLRAKAIDMLIWGPFGPAARLHDRLIGTVAEDGSTTFEQGLISSCEELEQISGALHRLRPTMITQLEGIEVAGGDEIEGKAFQELATKRWRDVVGKELADTLQEVEDLTFKWSNSSGVSAMDLKSAKHYQQSSQVQSIFGQRISGGPIMPFTIVQIRALFNDTSRADIFVGEVQLAFGDPLPPNDDGRRRVVVVPDVIASALTQESRGSKVELGLLPLPLKLNAVIETAAALLEDGGIYQNLEVAWDAAGIICA